MVIFPMNLTDPNLVFKVTAFLKSNVEKWRVLKTKLLLYKRKYVTCEIVLWLVTLTDL